MTEPSPAATETTPLKAASQEIDGAPGAIRTRGTRFRRAVLCPLSYGGAAAIVAFPAELIPEK